MSKYLDGIKGFSTAVTKDSKAKRRSQFFAKTKIVFHSQPLRSMRKNKKNKLNLRFFSILLANFYHFILVKNFNKTPLKPNDHDWTNIFSIKLY